MLTELKLCPFCGGTVKLEPVSIPGQGKQFYGVICRNTVNIGGTCAIEQIPSASKEAAIARWNRRAIESEVRAEAQEPVAWFVFADSNGPVPMELWGFDVKACKYAVLENARSVGWKGTIDGYLLHMGWTIRPLGLSAPQPPAPCPKCEQLAGRVEQLQEENRKAQREIAGDIVTIRECDDLLRVSRAKVKQQKQWLTERDEYAETLRAEIALLESKVESLLTYVPDALKHATLQTRIEQFDRAITRIGHHVGAVCAGVDTEDEHGPGGHTAVAIIEKFDALQAKVAEQSTEIDRLVELTTQGLDSGLVKAERKLRYEEMEKTQRVEATNAQQAALIEKCEAEFLHIKKVCLSEFGLSLVNENVLDAIAAQKGGA